MEQDDITPLPPHFTGGERDWFPWIFIFQGRIALQINADWLLNEAVKVAGPGADIDIRRLEARPADHPLPTGYAKVQPIEKSQFDPVEVEESSVDEDLPGAKI